MVLLGLCGACSSSEDATGSTTGDATMLPEGCDALVEPGADAYTELLGALMDAQPGQTVCMSEGTFNSSTSCRSRATA